VKRHLTVADAQAVTHRRSALELSQSDWSCRLFGHIAAGGGPTSREVTKSSLFENRNEATHQQTFSTG